MKKIAFLVLITMALSSCSVLPTEDEILQPPVIRTYESAEIKTARVIRSTISNYERVMVRYIPVSEETLSFTLDEYIEGIYVKAGDAVKKGDVLASLEKSSIEKSLAETAHSIEKLALDIKHLDESFAFEMNVDSSRRDILRQEYEKQMNVLINQMKMTEIKREQLLTDLRQHQLIAGMDGTVTYIKDVREGARAVSGERFIKLTDRNVSVFYSSSTNASVLKPKDHCSVLIGDKEIETVVLGEADAENLGLDTKGRVYLKQLDTSIEIEADSYGDINYLVEEKTDVLNIPYSSVHTANGRSFVYTFENNIKTMRDVVVGMRAEDRIEIFDGLKEGEQVVDDF